MAGTKTLFNSSGLECFKDLVVREHAFVFNNTFVTFDYAGFTDSTASVRITSNTAPVNGLNPIYRNDYIYQYQKVSLATLIPTDIEFGGQYPCTVESFKSYLLSVFGLLIEDQDFSIMNGSVATRMDAQNTIGVAPDNNKCIYLKTNTDSRRWIGGETIKIYLTSPSVQSWTPIVLTGTAVDGVVAAPYSVQYSASGGNGTLTYSVVAGTPPTSIDPVSGLMSGNVGVVGNVSWTVRVTDALGFYTDLQSSATFNATTLAITTTSFPDVTQGAAISLLVQTTGGALGNVFEITSNETPGLSIDSTGHITGELYMGSYSVTVKVTDQIGQTDTKTLTLNVVSRNSSELAASVLSKVSAWFEFDQGVFTDGDILDADYSLFGYPSRLTVNGNAIGLESAVKLIDAYLSGDQNLTGTGGCYIRFRELTPIAGKGILGRAAGVLGWELYFDDSEANIVRFDAVIQQSKYGVSVDTASLNLNTGAHSFTAQCFDQTLSLFVDSQLKNSAVIPNTDVDYTTSVPFTVAKRNNGQNTTALVCTIDRLIFLHDRLWDDEIAYLNDNEAGRSYSTIISDRH